MSDFDTWHPPMIHALKTDDAATLQQIFKSLTLEIHRLNLRLSKLETNRLVIQSPLSPNPYYSVKGGS